MILDIQPAVPKFSLVNSTAKRVQMKMAFHDSQNWIEFKTLYMSTLQWDETMEINTFNCTYFLAYASKRTTKPVLTSQL